VRNLRRLVASGLVTGFYDMTSSEKGRRDATVDTRDLARSVEYLIGEKQTMTRTEKRLAVALN